MPRAPYVLAWAPLVAGMALAALLTSLIVDIGHPFADLFHEGEYLGARLYFVGGAGIEPPVLIHGYLNYLPSQAAAAVCGVDRLIACTRAANAGLTAAAAFLFLGCLVALGRRLLPLALFAGIGVLVLVNGRMAGPVELHQGAPAIRDLTLLATLACLIGAIRARPRGGIPFAALGGVISGVGLFWAYSRGLNGLLLVCGYAAAAVLLPDQRRRAAWAVGGCVLAIGVQYASAPTMTARHFANIAYWIAHGEIWQQEFSARRLLFNAPMFLLSVLLLLVAGWRNARRLLRGAQGEAVIGLLLVAALALAVQQAFNRDDFTHMLFIIPYATLVLVHEVDATRRARDAAPPPGPRAAFVGQGGAIAALVGLVLVDAYSANSFTQRTLKGVGTNALHLVRGMPVNDALMVPEVRAVGAALAAANPRCTYALNNAGGFYVAAGLPPCARLAYPIYAAGDGETALLADLAHARPPVILATDAMTGTTDGRSLAQRTPRLAAFVARAYPYSARIGGTTLLAADPARLRALARFGASPPARISERLPKPSQMQ